MSPTCPLPSLGTEKILLSHGSGGHQSSALIEQLLAPTFEMNLADLHDSALLSVGGQQIAFTTDSYVVQPLVFSGGDIGSLAVNGTINDLAMAGARPLVLSCALILEEGFSIELLQRIIASMQKAACAAGARIVTGDSKVVEHGKGDGLYINTSGVGLIEQAGIGPQAIQAGDSLLVSGDIGRHACAIMTQREGLQFESELSSDCQQLYSLVAALFEAGVRIHCMRDITRGGLATVLAELAKTCGLDLEIKEELVPVTAAVEGVCELLGLEPLYMACEGRMLAIVPESCEAKAIEVMRRFHPEAALIGRVATQGSGLAIAETSLGTKRLLDLLHGDQLPRIC